MGVKLVIAGAPNVGKSSLLNRLARTDSAIVTDIPGTTRDVIRERVVIAGVPFDVHDTAGFRATSDPVERIGVERASSAIDDADLVLVLVDDRDTSGDADQALLDRTAAIPARIVVRNKIDLSGRASGFAVDERQLPTARVSALEGTGLAELEEAIVGCAMSGTMVCEDAFMAHGRHLDALERALTAIDRAQCRLKVDNAGEIVTEELRVALARCDHRRVRDRGSPRADLLKFLHREVRGRPREGRRVGVPQPQDAMGADFGPCLGRRVSATMERPRPLRCNLSKSRRLVVLVFIGTRGTTKHTAAARRGR